MRFTAILALVASASAIQLDVKAFMQTAAAAGKPTAKEYAEFLVKHMDTDGDKKLSADEFYEAGLGWCRQNPDSEMCSDEAKAKAQKEIAKMVKKMDKDGDKLISANEFAAELEKYM